MGDAVGNTPSSSSKHHPLPWFNVMFTLLKSIMREKRTKAWSPDCIWSKMLQTHFKSKTAEVQPHKGITSWPNEPAGESSNGCPLKYSMRSTSVLLALSTKGHKCLVADVVLVVYTCCHFSPWSVRDKSLCAKDHGKSIGLSQDSVREIPTEEQWSPEVIALFKYTQPCGVFAASFK